jgi:hypothetical protein
LDAGILAVLRCPPTDLLRQSSSPSSRAVEKEDSIIATESGRKSFSTVTSWRTHEEEEEDAADEKETSASAAASGAAILLLLRRCCCCSCA